MKTWTGFDPHSVRSVSATGINIYMKDPAFELKVDPFGDNTPDNVWLRAPGHMTAAMFIEGTIDQIARDLAVEPLTVQEMNLLPLMKPVWDKCKDVSKFAAERAKHKPSHRNPLPQERRLHVRLRVLHARLAAGDGLLHHQSMGR